MKFVSTRELRNRPGFVWELAKKEDLVLTAKGKPVGILVGVGEDDFEETTQAIRQAKAQRAVSQMPREAARRGLDRVSPALIEAEIRAVRSKQRSK